MNFFYNKKNQKIIAGTYLNSFTIAAVIAMILFLLK